MKYDPRGIYSPDNVVWKIHSDPSMLIGGLRALFEQALHPVAMAGVATHSNFREDAWGRLARTGDYVTTLTFGTTEEATNLAARVRRVHTKLGLDDPHELLWVHMAMVDSFLDTAVRSGLELSEQEENDYLKNMIEFADLVGVPRDDVPSTKAQLAQYFAEILPELEATDDAKRAAIFLTLPPLPNLVRFATPCRTCLGWSKHCRRRQPSAVGSRLIRLANTSWTGNCDKSLALCTSKKSFTRSANIYRTTDLYRR